MQQGRKCELKLGDLNANGLAFAFASLGEPGGEAIGEAFGSEAETGFEAAVGDGKSVVKISGIGEVAHAELIEPFDWTGFALATDEDIDLKFLSVHEVMITPGSKAQNVARVAKNSGGGRRLSGLAPAQARHGSLRSEPLDEYTQTSIQKIER